MSKVTMLVGLPASGKSTLAKRLSEADGSIILSSDELREELFGDVNNQENNGALFQELYKRARDFLKQGKDVIIDATNISQKRRINTLRELGDCISECYYFNTPYWTCIRQDEMRDREVGGEVIDRMYRSLQIPTYSEGWNKISLVHHLSIVDDLKPELECFEHTIQSNASYDTLFKYNLRRLSPFREIFELPHDSKYHTLNVSRHTYYVWEYILYNYYKEDRLIMLLTALLHDVGKAHTKRQKDGSRYFQYLGHEFVSGQLACQFLRRLGYDDAFIMKVVELVQLHMRLLQLDDNADAIDKLRSFVGEDVFHKLIVLREADTQAK